MNKTQKGFALLESLLIILILAIIGFGGYYVWHTQKNTDKSSKDAISASQSTSSTSTASSQKTAVAASNKAKSIGEDLLNYFNKNASTDQNWDKSYLDSSIADGQFTPAFKSSIDSRTTKLSFCTNNNSFESFTSKDASLVGATATVTLLQTASASSEDWDSHPKLTLNYVNGNWLVDKYICVDSSGKAISS